jgi:putative flippase GtrA
MIEQEDSRTKLLMLGRYVIAGGCTTLVYMVVYNLLVHFEVTRAFTATNADGLMRFFASNIAYLCALCFQYAAHSFFTFGHRQVRAGRLWRYLVTVGIGFILAALISQANTKLYTLPEIFVSLIVMVVVACTNFVFFTFWVYQTASGETGAPDNPNVK